MLIQGHCICVQGIYLRMADNLGLDDNDDPVLHQLSGEELAMVKRRRRAPSIEYADVCAYCNTRSRMPEIGRVDVCADMRKSHAEYEKIE